MALGSAGEGFLALQDSGNAREFQPGGQGLTRRLPLVRNGRGRVSAFLNTAPNLCQGVMSTDGSGVGAALQRNTAVGGCRTGMRCSKSEARQGLRETASWRTEKPLPPDEIIRSVYRA